MDSNGRFVKEDDILGWKRLEQTSPEIDESTLRVLEEVLSVMVYTSRYTPDVYSRAKSGG